MRLSLINYEHYYLILFKLENSVVIILTKIKKKKNIFSEVIVISKNFKHEKQTH